MAAEQVYGPRTAKRVRRTNAELADVDEAIIAAVAADSPVTLRGVYYRTVSAGAIDKTEAGYRLVGRQLLKLRRVGAVPYSAITDGTRWVTRPTTFTGIDQFLNDAAASYRRRLWHDSPVDVHVFTEKDAISGVVEPVTAQWDVPLGVLRGYASESFCHSVAEDIRRSGKRRTFIYQLGDHDPSGLDAWRDFTSKVERFAPGPDVVFERLAVTREQIATFELPTRPTKNKDTRAKKFTGGSVEVDAIPARALRRIVEDAIVQHIDPDAYRLTMIAEDSEREILRHMSERSED